VILTEYVECVVEVRCEYNTLVLKSEEKRQLWRSWHRLEDSIKIYFKQLALEGMDWIHLARVEANWRNELSSF
jgi:hypothetical protein